MPTVLRIEPSDSKLVAEVTGKRIPYDPGIDFKKRITEMVDLSAFRVWPTQVIIAHFIPEKIGSQGQLIAVTATKNEAKWQGKVGLVLKLGDAAFKDSPGVKFYGFNAKVGEWVMYRNSAGWDYGYVPLGSNTGDMIVLRMLEDEDIKQVVPRPDLIY